MNDQFRYLIPFVSQLNYEIYFIIENRYGAVAQHLTRQLSNHFPLREINYQPLSTLRRNAKVNSSTQRFIKFSSITNLFEFIFTTSLIILQNYNIHKFHLNNAPNKDTAKHTSIHTTFNMNMYGLRMSTLIQANILQYSDLHLTKLWCVRQSNSNLL